MVVNWPVPSARRDAGPAISTLSCELSSYVVQLWCPRRGRRPGLGNSLNWSFRSLRLRGAESVLCGSVPVLYGAISVLCGATNVLCGAASVHGSGRGPASRGGGGVAGCDAEATQCWCVTSAADSERSTYSRRRAGPQSSREQRAAGGHGACGRFGAGPRGDSVREADPSRDSGSCRQARADSERTAWFGERGGGRYLSAPTLRPPPLHCAAPQPCCEAGRNSHRLCGAF